MLPRLHTSQSVLHELAAADAPVHTCSEPDVTPTVLPTPCWDLQVGEEFILTIRNPAVIPGKKGLGVSYEAFVDDVQVNHNKAPSYHHASIALSTPTLQYVTSHTILAHLARQFVDYLPTGVQHTRQYKL